jgi:hypothetical protein
MEDEQEIQPVKGEVFPVSKRKILGLVATILLILPFAAALVWLWWTDTVIPVINKQVKWYGALIGLVGSVAGVFGSPLLIWWLLTRKERLILGKDVLQLVVSKGGEDVVRYQVPYDNIESVSIQKENDQTVVAVELRDLEDPDLYPANPKVFYTRQNGHEWHFSLGDQYVEPLESLRKKIRKRMQRG